MTRDDPKTAFLGTAEMSMREIVHRLLYWGSLAGVPRMTHTTLTLSFPTREAQCRAYSAILKELKTARLIEMANPVQDHQGRFVVKIEDVNLVLTTTEVPRGPYSRRNGH